MTFSFLRIGYVYVPTTRLDDSIAWYTQHLDFKLMEKFEDRGSDLAVLHHPHVNSIALLLIETRDKQPLEIRRNGKPFPIMALNCEYLRQVEKRGRSGGRAPYARPRRSQIFLFPGPGRPFAGSRLVQMGPAG
jgi:catechol 2,3-dioxygenase-like lactoylglutathione lyase family enzyme